MVDRRFKKGRFRDRAELFNFTYASADSRVKVIPKWRRRIWFKLWLYFEIFIKLSFIKFTVCLSLNQFIQTFYEGGVSRL